MNIWINAGELSGDIQAAALLRAIKEQRPDIHALGMGGEELEKAGMKILFHIRDLSAMGGTEILFILPRAIKILRQIRTELTKLKEKGQIAALILIDAPDFNFRVAKIAASLDIPVYYHIPPKIWAWRTGRIKFLAKYVKKIFCILPFEPDFYTQNGLEPGRAIFVGNPLLRLINWPDLQKITPIPERIGIMPGSRKAEINSLMPVFGAAAKIIKEQHPKINFVCMRASGIDKDRLISLWPAELPLELIEPEDRYQTMRLCTAIMAASGTATLEAALLGVPCVLAYKLSYLSYFIAKSLIRVPYVGLPNLILGREIFPECLQGKANAKEIAKIIGTWLDEPQILENIRGELNTLRKLCGGPDSAKRAAQLFLQDISP